MFAIWVGIGLAFLAAVAAFAAVALVPLSDLPTIAYACTANGLGVEPCARQAWLVGLQNIAAFSFVFAIVVILQKSLTRRAQAVVSRQDPAVVLVVLLIAAAVLLCHTLGIRIGPVHASRLDESEYFSNFISLENLLWPLLLQHYVNESDRRLRVMLFGALFAIMALTPYRAALFAIFVFGFVMPLAGTMPRPFRAGWPAAIAKRVAVQAAIVGVVGLVTLSGAFVDTLTRSPSMQVHGPVIPAVQPPAEPKTSGATLEPAGPSQEASGIAPGSAVALSAPLPPRDIGDRILQRLGFPLYQAAIAGHLAVSNDLPSLWDELGRKFRLSQKPTLEEFLFRRIFGGQSNGQTTSLYYGEATAYFPGPAIIWMVLGPLCIVAAAYLLLRLNIDATIILGIGLWRSSFSGLFPVLPAIVIQVACLVLLARAFEYLQRSDFRMQMPRAALAVILAVSFGAAFAVQAWMLAQKPARNAVLVPSFSVAAGCRLASPTWVSIRIDQLFADHGLSIRAATIAATDRATTIGVPYGRQSEALLPEMPARISTLVACQNDVAPPFVSLIGSELLPWTPNPLDLLATLALAAAFMACVGGAWGERLSRFRQRARGP